MEKAFHFNAISNIVKEFTLIYFFTISNIVKKPSEKIYTPTGIGVNYGRPKGGALSGLTLKGAKYV